MTRFASNLTLVLLSTALLHCSKSRPLPLRRRNQLRQQHPGARSDDRVDVAGERHDDGHRRTDHSASSRTDRPERAAALESAESRRCSISRNSAEVDQGKVAQTKAKNPRVKKFAAMMVTDHGKGKEKLKKLDLKPAESPLSVQLRRGDRRRALDLESTPAADFDTKYIDAQVEGHKKVLAAINEKLIPAATDPELKGALGRDAEDRRRAPHRGGSDSRASSRRRARDRVGSSCADETVGVERHAAA